jgi:hypothetical protein
MNPIVEFVKEHCRGWVIIDHGDRHGEADSYGIFHVSDQLARYIGGNLVWEANGACLFFPHFGAEGWPEGHSQKEVVICAPRERKLAYMFGYEYWRHLTFYPLNMRAELERAMYERKLRSRDAMLRLMRDTELRP